MTCVVDISIVSKEKQSPIRRVNRFASSNCLKNQIETGVVFFVI
jgi:hypothetical protein